MRLWFPILAALLLAGCGQSAPAGEGDSAAAGGEVTIELPPPLPVENKPGFAALEETAPSPKPPPVEKKPAPPAAEPAAPAAEEPAAAPNLVESRPPIPVEGLAGYIRGAGFECDTVVATSRAAGGGIYKFDCANGGSYRGTMKRNHLYFRPWSGSPSRG